MVKAPLARESVGPNPTRQLCCGKGIVSQKKTQQESGAGVNTFFYSRASAAEEL